MECVRTVSYSIMINGEPATPFEAARGLRQGDPMSPLLFAIGMEYWSRMLNGLKMIKEFHYHPRCSKLGISHLCFADDLLLFSRVYFGGVTQAAQASILSKLGYSYGELPFKYLGIPLATQKISLIQWQPLISKITAKISFWTARKLSYASRAQLIQTILFGLQAFWAQIYIIPNKVIKIIEAHCGSYLWSGSNAITKKALVAWDNLCSPKSVGGLNITNMYIWNRAAIAKHWWDIEHKQDKMWIRWIHTYYIKQQAMKCVQAITARTTVPWKCMMFQNTARPKVVFTIWLKLLGRLLTVERLAKWGIEVKPKCCLCQMHDETREHLFVQCEFTKKVWRRVGQWMQMQYYNPVNWGQDQQWLIHNLKGKSRKAQIFKLVCTEATYAIWIERNARIFEKHSRTWEPIAKEVMYVACVRATPTTMTFIALDSS
ncbi:uncharacterized protein LOC132610345 [Lycium barbarum]|uniref:uncharacterized protein LOC132610345 n=1 Tax=Lycium barbarum TaxID=112863 RepID=UPI00293F0CF4|nr:uncharacterized protein LOC132610345 [Lycium barbarum]